jgi:hypothetical protein
MRAYTLVGKLTGCPVKEVVHFGSSITATHSVYTAAADPRKVNPIATGSLGLYEKMTEYTGYENVFGSARRKVLFDLIKAPEDLKKLFYRYADRSYHCEFVKGKLLQVVSSKDFVSPPVLLAQSDICCPDNHKLYVPNYPHGSGSASHLDAFRMWIDHCFFGRPLAYIDSVMVNRRNNMLEVEVMFHGKTEITKATCYYVQTNEPRFLELGHGRHFKETEHFTNATWKSVSRELGSDRCSARISFRTELDKKIACFIQLEDKAGQTSGYTGSRYFWLESK